MTGPAKKGSHNIIESLLPLAVTIDKVKLDPRNARLHPGPNMAAIQRSLEAYGQRKPIVVNVRTGAIEAGNGLFQAAVKLGWTHIAAVMVADDEDTAKGYAIMDNQSALLAEWDFPVLKDLLQELDTGAFDMDLTGFNQGEIEDLMTRFQVIEPGTTDDDAVPEEVETICKTGDRWQLGNHRLLCGDATRAEDVERLMDGKKADMVFTDPPYGVDYEGGQNAAKRKKIKGDQTGVYDFTAIRDHVRKPSAWYIWFADRHGLGVYRAIADIGLEIHALIIWNKINPHYGAFMAQYMPRMEPCLYATTTPGPKWLGPTNEVNVWDVVQPARNELHPTMKPVALGERAIANSSKIGFIIFDPYGGSGSTLVACEKLKRHCFMLEIVPHYCDVIIRRWEDFTGRKAIKL